MLVMAKCTRCGRSFPVRDMVAAESSRRNGANAYICSHCNSVNEYYHTTNRNIVGTDKANKVLCGIEFECSFSDEVARNALFEYKFIPTHDCSIVSEGMGRRYGGDGNACEYVSGLMKGLNRPSKFALTAEKLIAEGHLKVNDSCGTHFHVSIDSMRDKNGNATYIEYIRRFYHSLFVPLTEVMAANEEKTKKLFGRTFGHYCRSIDRFARPTENRYLWVNVINTSNIEFRLNRYVNAKQYQALMKMEVDMVKCIVANFCEHFNDMDFDRNRYATRTAYRKHKADVTAQKLVKLFEKYAATI